MILKLLQLETILLLLTLIGCFLRKRKILTDSGRECLTDLVTDVILPCNIFLSFLGNTGGDVLRSSLVTVGMSVVIMVATAVCGKILYRHKPPQQNPVFRYGMICSNALFVGMPIIQSLLGADGVLQLSMFMIFTRLFTWTYCLALYTGTQENRWKTLKKLASQPAMIAAYLGILMMLTGWQLPTFLHDTMSYISDCLMALSMILVGAVLIETNLRNIMRPDVWGFCAVRLILIPAFVWGLCTILRAPYITTATCTLLCGMPAASLTAVLATRYRVDAQTASLLVTLSTILSTITIPVWFVLLQTL